MAYSTSTNINLQTPESAKTALKVFFNIMNEWHIYDTDQITLFGKPSQCVFDKWKCGEADTLDTAILERISYVIGIYKNLRLLFSEKEQANAWVHKPNEAFEGTFALDLMLSGNTIQLQAVRQYLDEQL